MSTPQPEVRKPRKPKKKAKKTNNVYLGFAVVLIILGLVSVASLFAIQLVAVALVETSNQVEAIQNFTEAQKEFNTQVIQWSQSVGSRLTILENETAPAKP